MSENHFPEAGSLKFQNEFDVLEKLGSGGFGVVFRVRNKLDGCEYAIKHIKLNPNKPDWDKAIKGEVQLLAKLNHRNVVRYYGSWIGHDPAGLTHDDDSTDYNYDEITSTSSVGATSFWSPVSVRTRNDSSESVVFVKTDTCELPESDQHAFIHTKIPLLYIQMELCEKRTLKMAIDDDLYKNEKRLWRLFRQITVGIAHVHYKKIIHRDLKPANIFLDSNYRVKIGDFGVATDLSCKGKSLKEESMRSLTGHIGTPLYSAPELTNENATATYNQKIDVYSLGIILFEMCNKPFKTGMERVHVVVKLKEVISSESTKIKMSHEVYQVHQVVRWLLNRDPNQRPSSQQLLDSEYLQPPGRKKLKKN